MRQTNQPATVWTVAAEAGVSAQTVSRVFRGKGAVSEKTRKKVLEVAAAQDYRPNAVARSLRTARTPMVGVAITDIANPFFSRLFKALEKQINPHKYALMLVNTDDDPELERRHLQVLESYRPSGLIIVPAVDSTLGSTDVESFGNVVEVSRSLGSLAIPSVVTDEPNAMGLAVNELVDFGHRNIAALLGPERVSTTVMREVGFVDALRSTSAKGHVRYTDGTRQGALEVCLELLQEQPGITGIIGFNSNVTEGILSALKQLGLRCPAEMSLIGFTDTGWMELGAPAITAISQPVDEMGEIAAGILLRGIAGENPPATPVVVKSSLVRRESVASART